MSISSVRYRKYRVEEFLKLPATPMLYHYDYTEFSSSYDMLWAQVQAMYRLIHYLRDALKTLNPRSEAVYLPQKHHVMLWSGSKTALVELIYALRVPVFKPRLV